MPPIPDYTESLPALLSAREKSADAGARGVRFDVTLGDIGFILAPSTQEPYVRETADVQKQQIDTSTEAGEQTLDGLWTRYQTSWHRGAGADYYEPGSRADVIDTSFRFDDSRGVDVWTQGQVSLLHAMDAVDTTAGPVDVAGAYDPTDGEVWFSHFGTTLRRHKSDGSYTDYATAPFTEPGVGAASAGSVVLLGGQFGVYSAPVSGGAPASLWSQALSTTCRPYWAKSRIVITRGPALYAVSLVGGDLDAATAHWTHPDPSWTWTGVAEAPDAILAAGHSGGQSAVFAMVMTEDSGGSIPKLSQPFQVAELPTGETVTAIRSYLGRYLAMGTSRGVRMALIGTGGQIQYGPLLTETDSAVVALEARGEFVYAATGSRVLRVSLAETIGDGLRFPYASDVEAPSGTITGLAIHDGRVVAAVDSVGTYLESATDFVDSGWLRSGKIRYGTTAPKAFRKLDVISATTSTDSVAVSAVIGEATTSILTLSEGAGGLGIGLGGLPSPQPEMAYYLELRSADASTSPSVQAVSVKAYPTPRRQRYVKYPLLLADDFRSATHTAGGWTGYATEVVEALEALESTQSVVQVEDRTRPERFEASIEKVQVVRTEPRAGNGAGNFGGLLYVTVKTL